jgi:putative membrane protein
MERFNDAFKSNLYKSIEEIEKHSLVEIVTVIRSNSGKYRDASLWFAAVFMFICSLFFMFSPIEFDVYLIWIFTFTAFIIGWLSAELIKPVKRLFIGKKRMEKNTEIFGRAVFQKGGIGHTEKKIGVLVYVSVFEKQVEIIPDRGAFTMIPAEVWIKMKTDFQSIFSHKETGEALISMLDNTKSIFSQYILPVENDINELPDNLEVVL